MQDDQELVTIYQAHDELDAEVVKIALAEEGISGVVDNQHQAGLTGVLPVHLQVSSGDAERARHFIRDHEASRGQIVE
jgi:hypothetical protein